LSEEVDRWLILRPGETTISPPGERGIGLVRHRLNFAIGDELREFVDTCG